MSLFVKSRSQTWIIDTKEELDSDVRSGQPVLAAANSKAANFVVMSQTYQKWSGRTPRTASMELRPMQYSIFPIDLPSKRLPD